MARNQHRREDRAGGIGEFLFTKKKQARHGQDRTRVSPKCQMSSKDRAWPEENQTDGALCRLWKPSKHAHCSVPAEQGRSGRPVWQLSWSRWVLDLQLWTRGLPGQLCLQEAAAEMVEGGHSVGDLQECHVRLTSIRQLRLERRSGIGQPGCGFPSSRPFDDAHLENDMAFDQQYRCTLSRVVVEEAKRP